MQVNSLAIDWRISMKHARHIVGPDKVLCGNVDPIVLYADETQIQEAVRKCISDANGKHVLNLGHGVEKDMTEEAVAIFVNTAKSIPLNSNTPRSKVGV
jgi:uroporphyrinogen-III decarboxylase